ncbi:hypothetical protein HYC85_014681, partial [Camellia sinensis]
QKPREQVADAEALLNITNTLVTSVKAHSKEGITPSDFVNCLLRDFGRQGGASTSTEDGRNSIAWKDVGLAVSHVFMKAPGCCTMYVCSGTWIIINLLGESRMHTFLKEMYIEGNAFQPGVNPIGVHNVLEVFDTEFLF